MPDTLNTPRTRKIRPQPRRVSVEAYIRAEEKALTKHEFHNGIIVPMAGAKLPHNLLAQKAASLIENFVEENNLTVKVSNSDTKIRIERVNKVVYPDAVVICEIPDFYQNRQDIITNPLLVVEVLSSSTGDHDRTTKFEWYRTLASFREYVLIHQDQKHVSVFSKQPDHTWLLRDYDGDDVAAILYAINECPLPLKRLYRNVAV